METMIAEGVLKTPRIIEAFRRVSRADFLPEDIRSQAAINLPLPIGNGQTNSQPLTVAFMLELLNPQPGEMVLDVGSGSGWTTALLSEIIGQKGKVVGIERIKEIFDFGVNNLKRGGFLKHDFVEFHHGDGSKGFVRHAPYDRILVSAMGENIPKELIKQLADDGVLVMPIGNSIWYVKKQGQGKMIRKEYPGFSFVPLIES